LRPAWAIDPREEELNGVGTLHAAIGRFALGRGGRHSYGGAQLRPTTLAQEATPAIPDAGPTPERVRSLLHEAHARFAANDEGENSQVYPALAAVPRDLFGLCMAGTDGTISGVGDANAQSVVKGVSSRLAHSAIDAS
jgi:hypothetical protein